MSTLLRDPLLREAQATHRIYLEDMARQRAAFFQAVVAASRGGHSDKTIADALGLTRARVHQIRKAASHAPAGGA